MNVVPVLKRITIYPVKSLDGISLQKAMITEGGCLLHDREYAMTDQAGNFIMGKNNPLVHTLRSTVNFDQETISFRRQDEIKWNSFHLDEEKQAIETYLSGHFGIPVLFKKNSTGRFLDIPDISGITILSEASLSTISEWYNNMDMEEIRRRFRATVEIEDVPAFWEDRLFSEQGKGIEFKIGDVTLFGMSPRARCVVPTRNPETAEATHAFPKVFARHRKASLPEWSKLDNFGHHYYLTVNCYVPASEVGKLIKVGDEVVIIGEKLFY